MDQEATSRVRRALTQQLESWQRAGVTLLSPAVVEETEVARPEPQPNPSAKQREPSDVRPHLLFDDPDAPPTDQTVTNRSTLSRDEREQNLAALAQRVANCTRCQELADMRTQTVFGVGNPEAELMFIGEAPGADEDRLGEPFVGRAGQLLTRIIEACRMRREDVYICNILRCRPPGNRNPTTEEAANCREYLNGQIETVNPDYIACMGSVAAQNLLDVTTSIGRMRGKFFNYGRAKVLCTYHPSYLLRNPAAKKDVWEDMKLLMREMGRPVE